MTHPNVEASIFLDSPRRTDRTDGIDALRGVLAIWVVLAHALPWARFAAEAAATADVRAGAAMIAGLVRLFQTAGETHPAVLAFIVLSGYCIHRNGLRADQLDIAGYARRRFFRIVPVYLLAVLLGVIVVVAAKALDPRIGSTLTATPAVEVAALVVKLTGISGWYAPWHFWSFQGNAPLTTVIVEMWLYAIYAGVMVLLTRGWRPLLLAGIVASIVLASALTIAPRSLAAAWWHNGSVLGFLLPWWIGAVAATSVAIPWGRLAAAAGGVWLVLTGALLSGGKLPAFGLADGAPLAVLIEARKLAFALLVAVLCRALDRPLARSWRPLVGLGQAGYSLYALHGPLLILAFAAGWAWWQAVALVVGISFLSFRSFEYPMTAWGRGETLPPRHS